MKPFLLALAFIATASLAQTYPVKPVRIIVATTPGSTQDVLARIVGGKLSDALKQAMVIDNRPEIGRAHV